MTVSVIWGGARYVCTLDDEPEPQPTPEPARVVAFSQRDPRWASVRLGTSNYTMGNAGCAVVAVTMIATTVKPHLTPLDMVWWLNNNSGFTSGGLLYWAKAAEYGGLRMVGYTTEWRKAPADLSQLKAALAKGPQVVQVDFKPATTALDSHFVTVLGFTDDGDDLNIIDPWTGERGALLTLYGQSSWTLERAVYALAEFERG